MRSNKNVSHILRRFSKKLFFLTRQHEIFRHTYRLMFIRYSYGLDFALITIEKFMADIGDMTVQKFMTDIVDMTIEKI